MPWKLLLPNWLRVSLCVVLTFGVAAQSVAEKSAPSPRKVVFLYYAEKDDGGWTASHERARQKVENELDIEITQVEFVEESVEAVREITDRYIAKGYGVFVGTSYGYGEGLLQAANAHPNVAFINVAGTTSGHNLETIYPRTYQAWYLAGMAAGAVSKSNKIGFIAEFPSSVVNWDINAFALGARKTNADVEVIAKFTNTWFDPIKEKKTAASIVEQGADVLASNISSRSVESVAKDASAYWVGYHYSSNRAAKGHLTSVVFNWDRYYIPLFKQIISGQWRSKGLPLVGLEIGLTDITPLTEAVPKDIRTQIITTRHKIMAGSFHPYTGPILNQGGEMILANDEIIDDGRLWTMDYFVEGIIGEMPQ